jgi:hypothetical protein
MTVQPTILCPVDFSTASAGPCATRRLWRHTSNPRDGPGHRGSALTEALDLGTGIIWRAED